MLEGENNVSSKTNDKPWWAGFKWEITTITYNSYIIALYYRYFLIIYPVKQSRGVMC